MIKLSKETTNELECLCGLCKHEVYDRSCSWAQMLESSDANKFQYDKIVKLIKSEVSRHSKTKKTKTKGRPNDKVKSKRK